MLRQLLAQQESESQGHKSTEQESDTEVEKLNNVTITSDEPEPIFKTSKHEPIFEIVRPIISTGPKTRL